MSWLKVRGLDGYARAERALGVLEKSIEQEQPQAASTSLQELLRDVDAYRLLGFAYAGRVQQAWQAAIELMGQHGLPPMQSDDVDTSYIVAARAGPTSEMRFPDLLGIAINWVEDEDERELLSLPQIAALSMALPEDDTLYSNLLFGRSQECVGMDYGYFLGKTHCPVVVWVHGGELFQAWRSFDASSSVAHGFIPFPQQQLSKLLADSELPDGRKIPVHHIDDLDFRVEPQEAHAIVMDLEKAQQYKSGNQLLSTAHHNRVLGARFGSSALARHYFESLDGVSGESGVGCYHAFKALDASVDGSKAVGMQLYLNGKRRLVGSATLSSTEGIFLGRTTHHINFEGPTKWEVYDI